ncbi:MAG TPA: hypothetical protein ENG51_18905 [Deltaproteobacteria bacterium]|nr:hypothetical protein [Deltaproteobacteria bacterium]
MSEEKMIEKCELCGKQVPLVKSHIIPKFATNWIKKTSLTGGLRKPLNPNIRYQDSAKIRLLCSQCEQKFSKWEKWFADNVFYKYWNGGKRLFQYNESLLLFILSLSWIGGKEDATQI